MTYLLGVDTGGTATRAVVTDLAGNRIGSGTSGGGNPNSHAPEQAAAHINEAITDALGNLDAAAITAAVVGMAGTSKLTDPAVAEIFQRAWRQLSCPVRVATDAEVAFASATSDPDGTVLVAGTGSIAGKVREHRVVATSGGYGWLLGDEGSAFWLGREAVRATLGALEGNEPLGKLARAVLAEAGLTVPDDAGLRAVTWRELITAANARAPVELARFAPLVSDTAAHDDRAARIVEDAGEVLLRTALAIRDTAEATPVVLAGAVVTGGGPVTRSVRTKLEQRGIRALAAADGVLGAAWLAAVDAGEHARHPQD